jgi:hypothetical protein
MNNMEALNDLLDQLDLCYSPLNEIEDIKCINIIDDINTITNQCSEELLLYRRGVYQDGLLFVYVFMLSITVAVFMPFRTWIYRVTGRSYYWYIIMSMFVLLIIVLPEYSAVTLTALLGGFGGGYIGKKKFEDYQLICDKKNLDQKISKFGDIFI